MKKQTKIPQVVTDVLNGKYGNGPARKINLEAAGYNYNHVQTQVNEYILGKNKPTLIQSIIHFFRR